MKILLFTKESEVERLGFAVRDYVKHIIPMVGLTRLDREMLSGLDYDIGIGFLYQYKIPKSELDRKTWINFHPGLLPFYGGRNLAYHAIMNGTEHFGCTVHYMDENFDTGDVISFRNFHVHRDFTAGDVNEIAINLLYSELRWILEYIVNSYPLPRYSQRKITYYPAEKLDENIYLNDWDSKRLRALTTRNFSAKINVNGVQYKVVKNE